MRSISNDGFKDCIQKCIRFKMITLYELAEIVNFLEVVLKPRTKVLHVVLSYFKMR